jgi:hypothetical protein
LPGVDERLKLGTPWDGTEADPAPPPQEFPSANNAKTKMANPKFDNSFTGDFSVPVRPGVTTESMELLKNG